MTSAIVRLSCLAMLSAAAFAQDLDRGIELYRKNNFSEAESVLRKTVEQQSDNARALAYLGYVLLEQHKAGEAEEFIKKANDLQPSGESKAALARLYIEQKNYDGAEEVVKEAEGGEVAYVRGLLNFHRDRHEDAARDLESYLENNPDHAYAHYYAGLAYNGMKRPDKMLSHFEMFLRLKPDAPEARKVRSVLRAVR